MKPHRPAWLRDAERVDQAIYAAVAVTPTPALDGLMASLSHAADRSKLWVAASAAMIATRGTRGVEASVSGLASVALASAGVNLVAKPLARRRRPDRVAAGVPEIRHVTMPTTRSWPSGHSASAFAFATGVAHVLPQEGAALRLLAALVAYSRVHTGVHFPADVVVGSLIGAISGQTATRALDRRRG